MSLEDLKKYETVSSEKKLTNYRLFLLLTQLCLHYRTNREIG